MTIAKALKLTISGSYRTSTKEVVDFEGVSGYMPFVDDEHATMHVQTRYAPTWIKAATDKNGEKLYKLRIEDIRQVFVDNIEVTEYDFSYIGKDIKEMSYEELQDVATLKDLRRIPLPKELSGISLREIREKAYLQYSQHVLGKIIDNDKERNPDYNYAKLPALIVGNAAIVPRVESSQKMTNEEIIEREQNNTSTDSEKSKLTLDELKAIADQKGITYHHKIGFDKLYALIFTGGE